MPHQCTNCGRTFDDGSKEMLSGCPDCGGNKFQFKPDSGPTPDAEPPEPPEPPEPTGSTVARTVGKTAATVKDLMGSSSDESVGAPEPADASSGRVAATEPEVSGADATAAEDRAADASTSSAPETGGSGATAEERRDASFEPSVSTGTEDSAQASARSEIVTPDEIPSQPATDEEHHFDPVSTEDPADSSTGHRQTSDGLSAPSSPDSTGTEGEQRQAVDQPDLQELREELNDQFESIKVLDPGKYELNLMELYDREEYIIALQEDGRYSIQVPENFRD